ncbi:MAG: hypothetical protein HQK83_02730 [Fibrobacteria bacterium]|nr:hypothetical protein [Fibrobacteria bacterium]
MVNYQGYTVMTGFLTGNLLNKDLRIDLVHSTKKYELLCKLALSSRFPGAQIIVEPIYSEPHERLPQGLKTLVVDHKKRIVPELEKKVDELLRLIQAKRHWVVSKFKRS